MAVPLIDLQQHPPVIDVEDVGQAVAVQIAYQNALA